MTCDKKKAHTQSVNLRQEDVLNRFMLNICVRNYSLRIRFYVFF